MIYGTSSSSFEGGPGDETTLTMGEEHLGGVEGGGEEGGRGEVERCDV